MIIKTKTQDCQGTREEERNEIIIVNCKFANGLLNDPKVFNVCITCIKKLLQLLPHGLEMQR